MRNDERDSDTSSPVGSAVGRCGLPDATDAAIEQRLFDQKCPDGNATWRRGSSRGGFANDLCDNTDLCEASAEGGADQVRF